MDGELYRKLLELNETSFEAGDYDVAYHILMAALHCAAGDRPALEDVRRRALKQLTSIDAGHPEYQHSSASAEKRGHISIFAMLADQARAMAAIAKMKTQGKR